jgi:hypothetical protein
VKGTKTQTSKKEGRESKNPNTPGSICFLLNTIRKNVLWDYEFVLFLEISPFCSEERVLGHCGKCSKVLPRLGYNC